MCLFVYLSLTIYLFVCLSAFLSIICLCINLFIFIICPSVCVSINLFMAYCHRSHRSCFKIWHWTLKLVFCPVHCNSLAATVLIEHVLRHDFVRSPRIFVRRTFCFCCFFFDIWFGVTCMGAMSKDRDQSFQDGEAGAAEVQLLQRLECSATRSTNRKAHNLGAKS